MGKNIGWRTIEEKQAEHKNLCELVKVLKEKQTTLKSQRNPEEFNAMLEQEIFYTKKQLKEISKRKHVLKIEINAQEKRQEERKKNPKVNTNTEAYKMFGKPLKELTKEEYRVYYNARQKINRQKRKEKTRITENTKGIKENTILKDKDGYFIVKEHDKQNNFYICIQCNKFGTIFNDEMYLLKIEDLIGAKIIKEG